MLKKLLTGGIYTGYYDCENGNIIFKFGNVTRCEVQNDTNGFSG
jgi:hypothetical protein